MSQVDCPKCDGKGYLEGFSHIANGRCFLCGGAGKVASADNGSQGEPREAYDPILAAKRAEFCRSVTDATLARMSYTQIWKAHNWAAGMRYDNEISREQFLRIKRALVVAADDETR